MAAYVDISVKYVGFPLFPVAQWVFTEPDSSFSSIDMITSLLSLFYGCGGTMVLGMQFGHPSSKQVESEMLQNRELFEAQQDSTSENTLKIHIFNPA